MTHQQEAVRFIENFVIIWVDSKLHPRNKTDDDIQTSITALRHIVNSIKTFDTCDACIDFIDNQVKEEKVFLIVSGSLGRQLVPRIENDIKLDSIYVFCLHKPKHEQWARKEQHRKIKGIFTDIHDICDQLKEDIKQCDHELASIQILGSQTSKILNHLDASFMYSQLLKEVLLSIEYDNATLEQAKEDFVNFCRIHYAENNAELCVIEEFRQYYSNPSPIWWYTRECFIHSMLNRALCSQDVEILIKMSFFICDLHRQLEHLHKTMSNRQILTVYRGQGMLHAAFDRMKQNQGGLISFNSFLSTSTSKEVSLCFAQKALKKPEKVAILFEMNIDPSISSVSFTSLDKLSYFQEREKEILFSMHTVFHIGEIKPLDNDNDKPRLWHVHLTLTDANDEQLRQLTEHMRMDLTSFLATELQMNMDPTWRLSKLLVNMGEYDKALTIYEMILDKATRSNNLKVAQATHYQMAELFMFHKEDWDRARSHLKKMFHMKIPNGIDVVDEVRNDLINVFSTIKNLLASEHIDEDEYHSTMAELLNKMVTFFLNYSVRPLGPLDYQLLVDRFNYIGFVRKKQGKLSDAWDSHKRALQILREHLPPTHPRLAITYNHISSLYLAVNNYSSALDCLEKALDIQEKALQPNHPHLAETHFHMSIIFERLNKVDDALQHLKKTIDIGRQAFLTSNDPRMKKYQEQFDKVLRLSQSCDELVL